MNITQRIKALAKLGAFLSQFENNSTKKNDSPLNNKFYDDFNKLISIIEIKNQWFTIKHVRYSISAIANLLTKKNLTKWINNYPNINNNNSNKTIGVIMAGNIPLVGFHDMLCVLISGHKFLGKMSSKDNQLIKKMYKMANIGIAISMTSSLTKRPNKKTFYYDPVKILSRTFEFCKNVKFDHTYIPHDFVLFCYKKSLYDF